ncbi:hypothetical protein CAPTEDRAFT_229107 [Capitella teleta]|uniref:Uncharacterized protein n=1 Tax=Capitella teleta TaxID=283909 RepID=R7U8Z5_CAPTE|nr:hypothetical protein CAPTEDRAFT_229107 [Capitella teleta]|eukprot:ELU02611.1 hypothetical protein CAPTEDRAFT_229107 [Capitella teleta]
MFTLDETVLRYTWNKEEGEVTYCEDILSLAPRPQVTVKEEPRRDIQCLCHHGSWKDLLAELEKVKGQVEGGGCTCGSKTAADGGAGQFNMPRKVFEQEVWHLYTYFLNMFNTRLKNDASFLCNLKKVICELVEQCIITMDANRYFLLQSIKSLLLEMLTIQQS